MTIICMKTKNDTNGNPRRVWCAYPENTPPVVIRAIEGYGGARAIEIALAAEAFRLNIYPQHIDSWRAAVRDAIHIDVTPAQYRASAGKGAIHAE